MQVISKTRMNSMSSVQPKIILMDNGSLKAAASLQLRTLAQRLSSVSGHEIFPVSLRHADKIPPQELAGQAAPTLIPFLTEQLRAGHQRFLVLPLFFAASGALTRYLPQQLETLRRQWENLDFTLADVVYPLPQGEPALVASMRQQWQQLQQSVQSPAQAPVQAPVQAILVDHGSPDPEVSAVRQHLAKQLRQHLAEDQWLDEAVMERRSGTAYDFNGELLETLLRERAQQGVKDIILLMQFFLPGRHAGSGGDIEQIISAITRQYPHTRIHQSQLVAQHEALIDILQARLNVALAILQ